MIVKRKFHSVKLSFPRRGRVLCVFEVSCVVVLFVFGALHNCIVMRESPLSVIFRIGEFPPQCYF